MNRIVINGRTITVSGNSVSVINDKVYVDGKLLDENKDVLVADTIQIYGDVENIETDKSVSCNNVKGNIKAGGSINCDNVGGNVNCGGSVNCDDIKGDVNAGGSINKGW